MASSDRGHWNIIPATSAFTAPLTPSGSTMSLYQSAHLTLVELCHLPQPPPSIQQSSSCDCPEARDRKGRAKGERLYQPFFFKAGQVPTVNMQNACISQLHTSHRGLLQLPWAANMCQQSKHRRLPQHTPKIKSRESRIWACCHLLLSFLPAPLPCGFHV